MNNIVITSAVRSSIGTFGRVLKGLLPSELYR